MNITELAKLITGGHILTTTEEEASIIMKLPFLNKRQVDALMNELPKFLKSEKAKISMDEMYLSALEKMTKGKVRPDTLEMFNRLFKPFLQSDKVRILQAIELANLHDDLDDAIYNTVNKYRLVLPRELISVCGEDHSDYVTRLCLRITANPLNKPDSDEPDDEHADDLPAEDM